MTTKREQILDRWTEARSVLELLPELPESARIAVELGEQIAVSVYDVGVEGLQALHTFELEPEVKVGRDEYGNLKWLEVERSNSEVTFFL